MTEAAPASTKHQRDQSHRDRQNPADRQGPPVAGEHGSHGVGPALRREYSRSAACVIAVHDLLLLRRSGADILPQRTQSALTVVNYCSCSIALIALPSGRGSHPTTAIAPRSRPAGLRRLGTVADFAQEILRPRQERILDQHA